MLHRYAAQCELKLKIINNATELQNTIKVVFSVYLRYISFTNIKDSELSK